MASSVLCNVNGPKPSRKGNLQPSVTFGENLMDRMSEAPGGSGYICEGTKNPLLETGSRLSFMQKWPNIHF